MWTISSLFVDQSSLAYGRSTHIERKTTNINASSVGLFVIGKTTTTTMLAKNVLNLGHRVTLLNRRVGFYVQYSPCWDCVLPATCLVVDVNVCTREKQPNVQSIPICWSAYLFVNPNESTDFWRLVIIDHGQAKNCTRRKITGEVKASF